MHKGRQQTAEQAAVDGVQLKIAELLEVSLEIGIAVPGPCCMDQPMDAVILGRRGLMQCERTSGVPAPACGSKRRQQLPPRLLDACRFAIAVHDR
jgi:hypothetical protein